MPNQCQIDVTRECMRKLGRPEDVPENINTISMIKMFIEKNISVYVYASPVNLLDISSWKHLFYLKKRIFFTKNAFYKKLDEISLQKQCYIVHISTSKSLYSSSIGYWSHCVLETVTPIGEEIFDPLPDGLNSRLRQPARQTSGVKILLVSV